MRQTRMFLLALTLLFATWAVDFVFGPIGSTGATRTEAVPFSDVRPVFKDRCSHCHRGPTDWTQYDVAKRRALTIRTRVCVFKNMPPISTEISDEERDLIKRWVDGGAKE